MNKENKKQIIYFSIALFCVAVACAMGPNTLSNYFNDVFHVTSAQRGFIEVPRETPGILCVFIVAFLGFIGNVKLAILSQVFVLIGFSILGFLSPSYNIMLCAIFISSTGEHLFMPLNDALSMSMAKLGDEGKFLGKFRGIYISGSLVGSGLIFLGFKTGLFSYNTKIIIPFAITLVFSFTAILFLIRVKNPFEEKVKSHKLVFKREYIGYYFITLSYGCQKRIRIVFAPWVIINLLGKGADTVALLAICCHFIGTYISPLIGKALDKYGYNFMLKIESLYIVFSFCGMGILAKLINNDIITSSKLGIILVFVFYILCYSFDRWGIVHSYYMKKIAVTESDVTKTLSAGISIDHVMAIIASPIMGLIWDKFGVQYVFYIAALSACTQFLVASKKETEK